MLVEGCTNPRSWCLIFVNSLTIVCSLLCWKRQFPKYIYITFFTITVTFWHLTQCLELHNFTVTYSKTCNISASSESLYYNLCQRNRFACARTDTHTHTQNNLIYQKQISSPSYYAERHLSRISRQESSNRITLSSKFERIWTEHFIVCCKVIFQNRYRRNEWNRENLNKYYLTCCLLNFVP